MASPSAPRERIWASLPSTLKLQAAPRVGDAFLIWTSQGPLTGVFDAVNDAGDRGIVGRQLDDALLRFSLEGPASGAGPTFVYGWVLAELEIRRRVRSSKHVVLQARALQPVARHLNV